jgi:hypothetical protein
VGDAQHRVLVRSPHHPGPQREAGLTADAGRERFPLDGVVVPALVLLVAREIHLYDPLRVLAWRLLHGELRAPGWLAPVLPSPSGAVDRDPIALAITSLAILVALAYAAAAPFVRVRWRAALLGLATTLLVVLPTIGLVAMGVSTGRPFGQDGGIVQLPLAMDRLLAGQTPYGADYSDSMLGKQARVSAFWRDYGGNPILRHHAYLPGTHLLMLPGYLAGRAVFGAFDARVVTLAAFLATAWLAWCFVGRGAYGLAAAALVLVNPLVWWHQVFGANDIMVAGLILASALAASRERRVFAGALLGLACATKQLAWPYAPFLVVHLMGAGTFRDLARRETWVRAARPLLAAAAVFVAVVVPGVALGPRAFWGDIVAYNVGLAGGDAYPLGGTPGFGFANLLLYTGSVGSLADHVSFAPFYLLLVPLGLLMLRRQMRERDAAPALVLGSVALVASLYVSRVVHPNYLVLAAILLPAGCLARRRDALMALGPLALLAIAVEYAQNEVLRAAWEQAVSAGASGFLGALGPRGGPHLTPDPLGALVSALVAGIAVLWLASIVVSDRMRGRVEAILLGAGALAAVVLPTALVVAAGPATGGPVRGQDPWLADVAYAGETAIVDDAHPPRVREAWSSSFRQEPPAALVPIEVPMPAAFGMGKALAALGWRDPRPLLLVALAAAAGLAWIACRSRLALALVLLCPAMAMGLAQGTPDALVVAALVAAFLASEGGRGAATGIASAFAWLTQFHVPATSVMLLVRGRDPGFRRVALAVWLGVLLMGIALVLGSAAAYPVSATTSLGPGGLLVYRGAEGGSFAAGLRAWTPMAAFMGVLLIRDATHRRWLTALVVLGGVWLLGESALWLGAPIVLLALGAVEMRSETANA